MPQYKFTTKIFIEKSRKVHGNKYDYSLVEYKNSKSKVKIICPNCGIFEQQPIKHWNGNGCYKCAYKNINKKTLESFIERAKKIHKCKYDYSLVCYTGTKTKVKIICPIHGVFEQMSQDHLSGFGCKKCSLRKTTDKFILDANIIHNNKYDYSQVIYETAIKKVKITCLTHGVFEQTPNNHLCGNGCPRCNESKGENIVMQFLEKNNINYITQKRFNNCKNKHSLPFDFYIPKHNICIEYDGRQHFETIRLWGGEKRLQYIQENDNIKNEYCLNNNINLLRISYKEDIEEKLNILFSNMQIKEPLLGNNLQGNASSSDSK